MKRPVRDPKNGTYKIKGKKSKKYFHIVYAGLLTRNHPYLSLLKNLKQNLNMQSLRSPKFATRIIKIL